MVEKNVLSWKWKRQKAKSKGLLKEKLTKELETIWSNQQIDFETCSVPVWVLYMRFELQGRIQFQNTSCLSTNTVLDVWKLSQEGKVKMNKAVASRLFFPISFLQSQLPGNHSLEAQTILEHLSGLHQPSLQKFLWKEFRWKKTCLSTTLMTKPLWYNSHHVLRTQMLRELSSALQCFSCWEGSFHKFCYPPYNKC